MLIVMPLINPYTFLPCKCVYCQLLSVSLQGLCSPWYLHRRWAQTFLLLLKAVHQELWEDGITQVSPVGDLELVVLCESVWAMQCRCTK